MKDYDIYLNPYLCCYQYKLIVQYFFSNIHWHIFYCYIQWVFYKEIDNAPYIILFLNNKRKIRRKKISDEGEQIVGWIMIHNGTICWLNILGLLCEGVESNFDLDMILNGEWKTQIYQFYVFRKEDGYNLKPTFFNEEDEYYMKPTFFQSCIFKGRIWILYE